MGTVLDTTIFIELECALRQLPSDQAVLEVDWRLEEQLGEHEQVAIAAITASELLHGVHRATEQHRGRREAFVEAVLAAFPVLSFDLLVARVYARLWASLATWVRSWALTTGSWLRRHWRQDGASGRQTPAISIGWPDWTWLASRWLDRALSRPHRSSGGA